jgi:hypothetical protein
MATIHPGGSLLKRARACVAPAGRPALRGWSTPEPAGLWVVKVVYRLTGRRVCCPLPKTPGVWAAGQRKPADSRAGWFRDDGGGPQHWLAGVLPAARCPRPRGVGSWAARRLIGKTKPPACGSSDEEPPPAHSGPCHTSFFGRLLRATSSRRNRMYASNSRCSATAPRLRSRHSLLKAFHLVSAAEAAEGGVLAA